MSGGGPCRLPPPTWRGPRRPARRVQHPWAGDPGHRAQHLLPEPLARGEAHPPGVGGASAGLSPPAPTPRPRRPTTFWRQARGCTGSGPGGARTASNTTRARGWRTFFRFARPGSACIGPGWPTFRRATWTTSTSSCFRPSLQTTSWPDTRNGPCLVSVGEGQVLLLGLRTGFRGQPRATFKLLLNPLYAATMWWGRTGSSKPAGSRRRRAGLRIRSS